ncbi:mitochondrial sodium/calcium exchanger protein-like [Schistocerca gregaria]|uniref:mitochondrial sodium/calcium exchanger protein-like n=1 Tax=Schistocerca gregaria TaxID=7010 RepID=UPI00211E976B|nr:mitochondrial sodium/calcium exchanger protein-like [Schistocerca gregaria]
MFTCSPHIGEKGDKFNYINHYVVGSKDTISYDESYEGGGVYIADVFPLWLLLFLVGAAASCLVFFTSEVTKAPRYHMIFAILGFISAMIIVFRIAGEVISILHCVGVVFRISEATIGLSILAWGNSVGGLLLLFFFSCGNHFLKECGKAGKEKF